MKACMMGTVAAVKKALEKALKPNRQECVWRSKKRLRSIRN